jgi:hypothetical protein
VGVEDSVERDMKEKRGRESRVMEGQYISLESTFGWVQ